MFNELKSKSILAVFLLAVALRLAFAFLTPNWQAPDEYPHFFAVKHVAHSLHVGKSKPVFPYYEEFQPPLYYYLGAQVYKLVMRSDPLPPDPNFTIDPDADKASHNFALIVLRLLSVVLGAATLLILLKTANIVFGWHQATSLNSLAFAGFLPTFIVNSASVTNDALANLLGALMLCLLLMPERSWRPFLMGVALGCGVLTKASLWTFVPVTTVALVIQEERLLVGLKKSAIVLGLAAVVSGWLFFWNESRYGSFLAINPGVETGFPLANHSLGDFWHVVRNLNWSFWAAAGRIYEVHLPWYIYLVIFFPASLLAFAGVARGFTKRAASDVESESPNHAIPRKVMLILMVAVGVQVAASLYYSLMYPINCSWGKYLYPVLAAISILFVDGINRIVGPRAGRITLTAFNVVLVCTAGYLQWGVIAG